MTSEFHSWARVIFFRQLVIRVGALGTVLSVLSTETLEPLIVQDGLDSVQGAYQSKAIFSRLVLVPNQASRLKGRCHEIVDPFLGKKLNLGPILTDKNGL